MHTAAPKKFSPAKIPVNSSDKPGPTPATAPQHPTPKAWWQWTLLYPTLIVAILGAIPTLLELIKSSQVGVPFGQSAQALEQEDLWAKNLRCTEAPLDGLVNPVNVYVDATICRSGDVLVRFMGTKDDQKSYRWVPVERFEKKVSVNSWLPVAMAGEPLFPMPRRRESVICQWQADSGKVIRKIRVDEPTRPGTSGGSTQPKNEQCFEETVRTSTGDVVNRSSVLCTSPCGPIR
ncbi:hypothetical protein POHY109586_01435 [Polaromonas hydrogenivorans]